MALVPEREWDYGVLFGFELGRELVVSRQHNRHDARGFFVFTDGLWP